MFANTCEASKTLKRYKSLWFADWSKVWIKNSFSKDVYVASKESATLTPKNLAHLKQLNWWEIMWWNWICLITSKCILLELQVSHTTPLQELMEDNYLQILIRPPCIPKNHGDGQVIGKTLGQGKQKRRLQFFTLTSGNPLHNSMCQPTIGFFDQDGKATEIWQKYSQEKNILPRYHFWGHRLEEIGNSVTYMQNLLLKSLDWLWGSFRTLWKCSECKIEHVVMFSELPSISGKSWANITSNSMYAWSSLLWNFFIL